MTLGEWLETSEPLDAACQFKSRSGATIVVRRIGRDLYEINTGAGIGTGSATGVMAHFDRQTPVFPVATE